MSMEMGRRNLEGRKDTNVETKEQRRARLERDHQNFLDMINDLPLEYEEEIDRAV